MSRLCYSLRLIQPAPHTMNIDWLSQHSGLIGIVTAISVLALLFSIIATPWIVARLPEDYLLQREGALNRHRALQFAIDALRTGLGAILIVFGLIMLVVPGPGLLTLLVGLSLARFPGKRKLLHRLASHESVFNSLNWMRKRRDKRPLRHPASIDQRKATLASALRSAQKLGESSPLKRLLQHDDPAQANRLNVYREYLFEAQQQTVTSAVRYLEKLEQAKHSAQKDRNWLNYIRDKASGQRLEHDQRALDKRQQIIIVEEQLQDQTRSVAQLQLDQQRLQQLMLELEAKRRDGAGYFASLQGQLDLPAVGELKARFGQTKSVGKLKWDGWFIAAQSGTPVRAVADGEVVYSNWLEGFGMLVILDHGDNYMTLYGGNRDVMAQTGTWVTAGSTIAQVGDSGGQNTSGLYFEIRRNARALDPEKWLKAASS